MDLSGQWRASRADDDLRRAGVGLDFDDSSWPKITVPGHWRSSKEFADCNGPLLYRKHFVHPRPGPNERTWVVFDGIFYQADVWLDGAYLGDPEGYFFPHCYDITSLARLGESHALAVELNCAAQNDKANKRLITGAFQHSDSIAASWNPGGIWRPVRIETTGPVRIERLRVLCRDANADRADFQFVAQFDSDTTHTVRLRTTVGDYTQREREQSLARGTNEVTWTLGIDNPALWWPWSLGDAALCDVTVEVLVDHQPSHAVSRRIGVRTVGLNDWVLSVNGERLFAKGVNYTPTRRAMAEVDPALIRRDLEIAKDTGFDMIRVNSHIGSPELYDIADELGLLIWQDFPLHRGYSRHIADQASRQVREAVDLLGHHPSVVMWCGHDEPFRTERTERTNQSERVERVEVGAGGADRSARTSRVEGFLPASALRQQQPSWNRSLLDRRVKRAFERADESRPVVAHSGVLPHFPQLSGTDTHLFLGWYSGLDRDLVKLAANLPRLVRFVGAFGSESVPGSAAFAHPERWPNLDWEQLADEFGLQREPMEQHVPPGAYATFDEWRTATQVYQANLLRFHVETLRRLKYAPTGGFCLTQLTDPQPAISFGLLDAERVPKLALNAVAEACRPLIVVADWMPLQVHPGDAVALDVHVISDLRVALKDATVDATLAWSGGQHEWSFTGTIDADSCCRVGAIRFVVPAVYGALQLDLVLSHADGAASNRYTTAITPHP